MRGRGAKAPLLHSPQKVAPKGPSRDLVYVGDYVTIVDNLWIIVHLKFI